MTDYISRLAVLKAVFNEGYDNELDLGYMPHNKAFQEIIEQIPDADVVPWEWLESYSYMFCACWFSSTVEMDSYKVLYLNFIREAKRFYKASLAAMEGGHIGD